MGGNDSKDLRIHARGMARVSDCFRNIARLGLPIIDRLEAVADLFAERRQEGRRDMPVRNILIWSMDRIGDVVRSTPAIRMLKKLYPDAAITAVVPGRSSAVLVENPWIVTLHIVKNPYSLREHAAILRKLGKSSWDLGVLLETEEYWEKLGQICFRFLAVRRMAAFDFGRHYPPWTVKVQIGAAGSWTDQFVKLAEQIGGEDDREGMEIRITSEERGGVAERLISLGLDTEKPFFLIHPGGNLMSVSRQWPSESFARLITLIRQSWEYPIAVTGVQEESSIAQRIQALTEAKIIDICGLLNLRELMAVISLSTLFISNDTGPLHIAHALGVPTIAIIGPTDPEVIGFPHNGRFVRMELPCSPCISYLGWNACRNPDKWECMTAIDPDQVVEAVAQQMKRFSS